MKKALKYTVFAIQVALVIVGCRKNAEPPLILPLQDNSIPSAAISNSRVIKSGDQLTFSVDITVFRDSKNVEGQLKAANFSIDTPTLSSINYFFTRQQVNLNNGASASPYSALLLMDQSGSILSTDPKHYRLEAATAFCSNLGSGDNVALFSFAGSSLQQYGTGFTTEGSVMLPLIQSLKGKEGGATPLYKSQFTTTSFAAANAPLANKAVMTFTDGEDTEAGKTTQEVINNALALKIKLFNIGLGAAQIQTLGYQSEATGGAFMFARDARQLISMFGNLGKMLNGTAQYYHTVWQVSRSSGSFSSGTLSSNIRIVLPYSGEIVIPFSIKY